ncbi:MAG TPA: hypothetical protein VD862_01630 [Candidatus Paceibacterota bacterium]|nr:hypothetical protein [Candidatus Paceibacterota bacterium]
MPKTYRVVTKDGGSAMVYLDGRIQFGVNNRDSAMEALGASLRELSGILDEEVLTVTLTGRREGSREYDVITERRGTRLPHLDDPLSGSDLY